MRLVLSSLILFVSACASNGTSEPLKEAYCDALRTWVEAMPESDLDQRYVRLFQGGCSEGRICMYSLGWKTECDECADAIDRSFVKTIAPMTHHVSINEFAEYSEQCLSHGETMNINVMPDNPPSQSVSLVYKGTNVIVDCDRGDCGFYGCTTLSVSYK